MAAQDNEKSEATPDEAEPSTVDESRSARYRREHGEFLAHSLRPLPPLSPPPPPPSRAGEWLGRTLWFLVTIYGTFMAIRWLARWIVSLH